MKRTRSLLEITLAVSLCGCATAATSSNENTTDAGASKDAASSNKDSGTKKVADAGATSTDDASTTDFDSGGPIDDTTCEAQTSKSQCEQCCLTVHPTGYDVYHQELVSCACTSPGPCASDCATELCANQPTTPGDACETCINASLTQGTGACYDGIAAACQSDTDCTALFSTCIPPCESK